MSEDRKAKLAGGARQAGWRRRAGVTAATMGIALAGWAVAPAADAASVEDGHRFATLWCANCHSMLPEQGQPVTIGVPSFVAIANRRDTTGPGLAAYLLGSHPAMPGTELTRAEADEIVAYILNLRQK